MNHSFHFSFLTLWNVEQLRGESFLLKNTSNYSRNVSLLLPDHLVKVSSNYDLSWIHYCVLINVKKLINTVDSYQIYDESWNDVQFFGKAACKFIEISKGLIN